MNQHFAEKTHFTPGYDPYRSVMFRSTNSILIWVSEKIRYTMIYPEYPMVEQKTHFPRSRGFQTSKNSSNIPWYTLSFTISSGDIAPGRRPTLLQLPGYCLSRIRSAGIAGLLAATCHRPSDGVNLHGLVPIVYKMVSKKMTIATFWRIPYPSFFVEPSWEMLRAGFYGGNHRNHPGIGTWEARHNFLGKYHPRPKSSQVFLSAVSKCFNRRNNLDLRWFRCHYGTMDTDSTCVTDALRCRCACIGSSIATNSAGTLGTQIQWNHETMLSQVPQASPGPQLRERTWGPNEGIHLLAKNIECLIRYEEAA